MIEARKEKIKRFRNVFVLLAIFLGLSFFGFVFASTTNGTIDSTYKYAWSDSGGWLNFGTSNGNVHITDSGITGYVWNENYGWINMSPTYSGVSINASGALSGYGWGQSCGWVNFSGVSINCSGQFTGTATNDALGTITFNCTNCKVVTDYLPQVCRVTCGNGICGGGEACDTCPADCGSCPPVGGGGEVCGNGFCAPSETCASCPGDCGQCYACGNGSCSGTETCISCPADCGQCPVSCGNEACDESETCHTCPADCGQCLVSCGDGSCNNNETCESCPNDCGACPPYCGDKTCNGNETCHTCPADCGQCHLCGDRSCSGTETCISCPADCGQCPISCGNETCDGNETCHTCPADCGTCPLICGDTTCNINETCLSCFVDCGVCPTYCGDGQCNGNETCDTCSADCGVCGAPPPISCGDRVCNENETCDNCPTDCGQCVTPPPISCGDGTCSGDESCDNCQTDCGTCKQPVIPEIFIPPIIPPQIKKIVKTPIGSVVTKVVSTTGVATTVVTTAATIAFVSPISLPELFLLPIRLMGLILTAFGWKKRNPPWGVVYDSVTKQPLDPAYVVLKDLQGKNISSAITDLDGRYGFLAEPGFYKITANKTNYLFPSQKLFGKTRDELYDNLYFGDQIEIKRGEVITRNIPLDSLKFDWNEFVKQNRGLTRFYSRWDSLIRKISDTIFVIGFIIAVIAFFSAPYPYNTIILGLYLFLTLLRILGVKPKQFGYAIDRISGMPLAFAIIRIEDPYLNREMGHRITDKYGRYFCLVPRGKYYVKIEKKNDDGSYSLVHTSSIIDASKSGIIKNKFKV